MVTLRLEMVNSNSLCSLPMFITSTHPLPSSPKWQLTWVPAIRKCVVSGHASPSSDVIIIGEYNIPRHVIWTFSLRVDNIDSLPLTSNGGKELLPGGGDSGLGDLTRGTELETSFFKQTECLKTKINYNHQISSNVISTWTASFSSMIL